MKNASLGARIPGDLKQSVERLSQLSGQSISSIAETAIRDYVEWRVPQLLDLQEAIAAADRGEFASEEEVDAFFRKHAS